MKTLTTLSLALSLFFSFSTDSYCQSSIEKWNMFRGPNGSGIDRSSQLPAEIGPETNVIWKVDIPNGYSSPVLTKDYILITGEESDELFTLCLSRKNGEIVWKSKAPRPRIEKLDNRNNAASPSVVTDGESVFVFFADYGLLAYDMTGNEKWSLPLGPFNNVYGMGASPILAENNVVLVIDQNLDSYIIAVDKNTGQVAWKVNRPEATSGHSTPITYETAYGETQILVPGSFKLSSYKATTGELAWWVNGLSFEMKSTPVLWKDMVFVNGYATPMNQPENLVEIPDFEKALNDYDKDKNRSLSRDELPKEPAYTWFDFVDLRADGGLDEHDWNYFKAALASLNGMLGIRLGGNGDMTETNIIWTYHKSIPQLPSPLIYKHILYMINDGGYVTTFDPETGKIIDEGRLPKGGTHFYASPVASDDKVYIISRRGKISVLKSGGMINPIYQSDLEEMCFATPAISDGKIYLRTVKSLYCFGIE